MASSSVFLAHTKPQTLLIPTVVCQCGFFFFFFYLHGKHGCCLTWFSFIFPSFLYTHLLELLPFCSPVSSTLLPWCLVGSLFFCIRPPRHQLWSVGGLLLALEASVSWGFLEAASQQAVWPIKTSSWGILHRWVNLYAECVCVTSKCVLSVDALQMKISKLY